MGVMSRRDFGLTVGAGLPALGATARAAGQSVSAADARALYARAISIDALANPGSMNVPWPPKGPLTEAQRAHIAKSGLTAINTTVSADKVEPTVANIALWTGEAARYPTLLSIIRRHDDLARARAGGQLGIILGFQDTEMLERDLSRLDMFRRLGVLIIQLTYNVRNLLGDGCLEPGDAGLSTLGVEAVERMNALGIAVDLSHCGTRTTATGIAASAKPPLITHSGCREVYRHPRSKEDRELKAMADKGGVVGIYLMPFLGGHPGPGKGATPEMLVRQIDDPSLSETEIALIAKWADSGAPRGNPADMPVARVWNSDTAWQIGTPDLVVKTSEITVKGTAPDWWGEIPPSPTGLTEDRYVAALEVREVNDLSLIHI